jgi:hypothetical protein
MKKPKLIKKIQARSRDLKVMNINPSTMLVESKSDDLNNHTVTVQFMPNGEVRTNCTCEWSTFKGVACVHTLAALEHLAARKGRTLSFWLTEDDAKRQKQRIFYLTHERDPDDGIWITSRAG